VVWGSGVAVVERCSVQICQGYGTEKRLIIVLEEGVEAVNAMTKLRTSESNILELRKRQTEASKRTAKEETETKTAAVEKTSIEEEQDISRIGETHMVAEGKGSPEKDTLEEEDSNPGET
jgi:isoaspartyl peptidase/L-asparaginase-like protein (Ntn-hydrolase superfamily)